VQKDIFFFLVDFHQNVDSIVMVVMETETIVDKPEPVAAFTIVVGDDLTLYQRL
jgi:hypothetical protein